jgi:hypothetical protein
MSKRWTQERGDAGGLRREDLDKALTDAGQPAEIGAGAG